MKKRILDMRGLSPAETCKAQAMLLLCGYEHTRKWVRALQSLAKSIEQMKHSVLCITTPNRESAYYRMYKQYERSGKHAR